MASPSLGILRLQSDERLVELVRTGHERPFEAIVERYRRPLLRHARRLVGEARAEDAVQQALLSAWAALRRGDDVRDLPAWLHRIVHNTALNALRGQRDDYAELRESLLADGAPHEVLERRLIVRETLETVAALPERQREALLRIAVEGRSQEEVADALGLTHGAVRQLVHRARTTLRAAATAVTPWPAAAWLAATGSRTEPLAGRIAEMVGAAGSAGVAGTLAKAGTVAVIAGGAATTPGLVEHDDARPPAAARAATAEVAPGPPAQPRFDSVPRPFNTRGPGESGSSGHGSGRSGSGGSDSSGPGPGGSRRQSDSSGPGSGGSGSGGSDSSGPGSGDSGSSDSGSSGSGPVSLPDDSDSGGGSGSNGSGSSGSGSSGSGSSGSGSSGSGSSGSGSSGSGSSGSGSSGSGSSGSGSSGSGSSGSTLVAPALDSSGSGSGDSGSSGSGSSGSGSGSSGPSSPDDSESEDDSGSSGSGS